MKVVSLKPPSDIGRMLAEIDALRARVEAAEFETLMFVAIKPDGRSLSCRTGKHVSHYAQVGILETMKIDLITEVSEDEPA